MAAATRILAIDTISTACSVALFEAGIAIAHRHERLGRGHAERLVPMISELPDRGRAERILVDVGPGSFTGVRVGLAAARALALAWGAEISGYCGLALLAAMARETHGAQPVAVATTGGHGEWFVAEFSGDGAPLSPIRSLEPDAAAQALTTPLVVGDMAERLVALRGSGEALTLLPDARRALLPGIARDLPPSALYGRGPDAKLPGARA